MHVGTFPEEIDDRENKADLLEDMEYHRYKSEFSLSENTAVGSVVIDSMDELLLQECPLTDKELNIYMDGEWVDRIILPQKGDIKEILAKHISISRGLENIYVPPKNTEQKKTTKTQARLFTVVVIQSVKHHFQEDLRDPLVQPEPNQICGLYHLPLTKGRTCSDVCVPILSSLYDMDNSPLGKGVLPFTSDDMSYSTKYVFHVVLSFSIQGTDAKT
jgi:hypothetical protein